MAGNGESATRTSGRGYWAGIGKKLLGNQEFGIFIAVVLLFTFFALKAPVFASLSNLMNLGRQISTIGIMAVGMTVLVIGGEFDLSVGSIFCFASGLSGMMMLAGVPIWIAVVLRRGGANGACAGRSNPFPS